MWLVKDVKKSSIAQLLLKECKYVSKNVSSKIIPKADLKKKNAKIGY